MFGSVILEVIIGISFIFFLVSIICSAIKEGIEVWLKTRASFLEYGLRMLLQDTSGKGLVKSLYNHPLINSLFSEDYKPRTSDKKPGAWTSGRNLPSYIPAKNFAVALMDIAARGPLTDVVSSDPQSPVISLENVRANVQNMRSSSVQRAMLTAIDTAQGDINKAQKNIQDWYDSSMDRVSGWYKRSSYRFLFVIVI